MKYSRLRMPTIKVALACVTMAALPHTVGAMPMGYALANGGDTLLSFDLANPSAASSLALTGGTLDAIDFRPATGQLYGYDDSTNAYFTVDLMSGVLTTTSVAPVAPTMTPLLDIDWNPTIDRMRLVTADDSNVVFNPDNGATTQVTDLAYDAGDANNGVNPNIVANGYTNSMAGAVATQQYALDSNLDVLTTLANNAGTLSTVGMTGVDFNDDAALDILTTGMVNVAYAVLTTIDGTGLYTVDLGTGSATLIDAFSSSFTGITGLAVTHVPVPSAAILMLAGIGMMVRQHNKASGA